MQGIAHNCEGSVYHSLGFPEPIQWVFHILNFYFVPGTVLVPGDAKVSKGSSCLQGVFGSGTETRAYSSL